MAKDKAGQLSISYLTYHEGIGLPSEVNEKSLRLHAEEIVIDFNSRKTTLVLFI